MRTKDWQRDYVITSLALTTPAVRMAYVLVGRDSEDTSDSAWWTIIKPVLALQSEVREEYIITKRHENDFPELPHTAEERNDENWRCNGKELVTGAIVLDDDYGLISTSDSLMLDECANSTSELVPLPWPYDEVRDTAEIQRRVPYLRKRVDGKIEDDKKRREKAEAKLKEQSAA